MGGNDVNSVLMYEILLKLIKKMFVCSPSSMLNPETPASTDQD